MRVIGLLGQDICVNISEVTTVCPYEIFVTHKTNLK